MQLKTCVQNIALLPLIRCKEEPAFCGVISRLRSIYPSAENGVASTVDRVISIPSQPGDPVFYSNSSSLTPERYVVCLLLSSGGLVSNVLTATIPQRMCLRFLQVKYAARQNIASNIYADIIEQICSTCITTFQGITFSDDGLTRVMLLIWAMNMASRTLS